MQNKIKIGKTVMVAPFNKLLGNEMFDTVNKTFLIDDNEAKEFKRYCEERICIYIKDDPYIGFDAPSEFAKMIEAEKVIYETGKHLNLESGYKEFKDLLNYI